MGREIPYLLLSPSLSFSFCPSLHTNPEAERCHNKPGTNGGKLIFSISVVDGKEKASGHGSESTRPLKYTEQKVRAQIAS